MAPQTRSRQKALAAAAPVIDAADRLSQLHPDLQAHILSFLPAQEAVRTSVLARTWRDREVWKLTRRLLITSRKSWLQDVRGFVVRGFVDRLLALRLAGLKDHGPIHACEISFFWGVDDGIVDDDVDIDIIHAIERWIRLILQCHVQSLVVDIWRNFNGCIPMRDMPLVSRHLTTLELSGIYFEPSTDSCLDFSGSPALQHLEITVCDLSNVSKVTSPSVKRLVITEFYYWEGDLLQICFPHLVSLCLEAPDDYCSLVLESMPQLEVADVKIGSNPFCESISDDAEEDTVCLVLPGLAEAKHLVLLSDDRTITFEIDLKFCPTYSKLKTLVLNHYYWCKSADCSALACILQHAPVLEKLTVVFSDRVEPKYDMVVEGRPDATGNSTMISQHLKIVELKCSEVNQRVVNVLNFLGTLNIWFLFRSTEASI